MKMSNTKLFSRLIPTIALVAVFALGAQAYPVIHWDNASGSGEGTTSKLGALTYGSQWNYTDTYYDGGATESSLNQKVTSVISVNENNVSGVSYADSVFYAESISDTLSTNGRGGLVQNAQDGGWGKLQIVGKADSSRGAGYVRTYTEATADAYVTFSIHSDEPQRSAPVLVKFTVEFASDAIDGYTGDLNIYRDRDPVAGTEDRFCNFATFGGMAQEGRPAGYFILEEDENTQILYDINGNPVDHVFDDPSRPEQYDATNPNALWGPGSGRGAYIPGEYLVPYADNTVPLNTNRTYLYNDDLDGYVDAAEMQEALLQTSLATDPGNHANDPLYTDRMEGTNATAMQYSRGNVTFDEGLQSYVTYFWVDPEDFDDPMSIYVQLSANLAVDGGIEGLFGSTDGSDQYATMFYNVQIVPEPGTIILIGSALVGLAAFARKRLA